MLLYLKRLGFDHVTYSVSGCPPRRERLGLLQNRLYSGVLKVRRVAVFAQDALDQNSHSGTRGFTVLPVYGRVGFQAVQQLKGDDFKLFVGLALRRRCWSRCRGASRRTKPNSQNPSQAGRQHQTLTSVAQFEREMMLERQREGIAKAKADGKYKGRKPTAPEKASEVRKLRQEGIGATAIAKQVGIGRATVYRLLESAGGA